jgi:hypothetical protein
MDIARLPYVSTGTKLKRNSVPRPVREGPKYTSLVYGYQTDGVSCVWKVLKIQVVPNTTHAPHLELSNSWDRETIQKLIEESKHLIAASDPGRRDIEKWFIRLTPTQAEDLLRNPAMRSRLDKGLISRQEDGRITVQHLHQNYATVHTYKKNLKPPVLVSSSQQDFWETRLVLGMVYLVRNLSLDEYYRVCGFTDNSRLRQKETSKKITFGVSVKAIYKSLPSMSTFSYLATANAVTQRLLWFKTLVEFEHGEALSSRCRKLRIFSRRNQARNRIANDLAWNPFSGTKILLFHGGANFAVTSRGLKSGPNGIIQKLLSTRVH